MAAPLIGAGLLLQGLGALQEFQGIRLDEKINRNISAFNAKLADRDAELSIASSRERAKEIRENTDALISKHRAAFGASNIVSSSGSPLLAQLKQREEGEKAAQSALLEGKVQAAGFSARKALAQFESDIARERSRTRQRGALLGGATGLLSTGSKLF